MLSKLVASQIWHLACYCYALCAVSVFSHIIQYTARVLPKVHPQLKLHLDERVALWLGCMNSKQECSVRQHKALFIHIQYEKLADVS